MKFKEVIGQHILKKQLIRTVTENRVSHAQLFAGPEGSGNLSLALAFAQYISCENRSEHDSCGICKSCIKYAKLVHPDLHFVFPVINTSSNPKAVSENYIHEWRKAILENSYLSLNNWIEIIASENKQGGIFEKESGEILYKLNLKTYESDYKIMIIWMAEKMHTVTANKLLKIIEEPPSKTLFILVSENPDQILSTILSRCQYVKVPPIDTEDIQKALEHFETDKPRILEISRIAAGNYLKALDLIHSGDEDQNFFGLFVNLMRNSYKRDVIDLVRWSEETALIGREKQKKFLNGCLHLIRENFVMTEVNGSLGYLNKKEAEFSEKFHPYINQNNIESISNEFNLALHHIESNGNSKIIFLDLALKMSKLIKK